ncbi:hypothetical protein [Criblamydia sequanensis]|uniref:Uncharacterized protein n=1 Tax=Candidatus Criblamydia sequanensis CRIB-18 TaxID=1437425 RepID=A0A090D0U0_9BACT|nr:hypothetical protein [Criblamydia sequanensis]CDR34961.1 hypothetical protein CSEC_2155 [Criblamydia sequanensis CRIB-18]
MNFETNSFSIDRDSSLDIFKWGPYVSHVEPEPVSNILNSSPKSVKPKRYRRSYNTKDESRVKKAWFIFLELLPRFILFRSQEQLLSQRFLREIELDDDSDVMQKMNDLFSDLPHTEEQLLNLDGKVNMFYSKELHPSGSIGKMILLAKSSRGKYKLTPHKTLMNRIYEEVQKFNTEICERWEVFILKHHFRLVSQEISDFQKGYRLSKVTLRESNRIITYVLNKYFRSNSPKLRSSFYHLLNPAVQQLTNCEEKLISDLCEFEKKEIDIQNSEIQPELNRLTAAREAYLTILEDIGDVVEESIPEIRIEAERSRELLIKKLVGFDQFLTDKMNSTQSAFESLSLSLKGYDDTSEICRKRIATLKKEITENEDKIRVLETKISALREEQRSKLTGVIYQLEEMIKEHKLSYSASLIQPGQVPKMQKGIINKETREKFFKLIRERDCLTLIIETEHFSKTSAEYYQEISELEDENKKMLVQIKEEELSLAQCEMGKSCDSFSFSDSEEQIRCLTNIQDYFRGFLKKELLYKEGPCKKEKQSSEGEKEI